MAKTQGYDQFSDDYDQWFEEHTGFYQSELSAVKALLPKQGQGVEVGVGSGRFAAPLKIHTGIEPSTAMREKAIARGVQCFAGTAEALPLPNESFDFALFVTSVCFFDNPPQAFQEAYRVIKPNGSLLIAFIEKNSALGQKYEQSKMDSPYYCDATFYSTEQLMAWLTTAGFHDFKTVQTLFSDYNDPTALQPIKQGYDQGAFVVLRAEK